MVILNKKGQGGNILFWILMGKTAYVQKKLPEKFKWKKCSMGNRRQTLLVFLTYYNPSVFCLVRKMKNFLQLFQFSFQFPLMQYFSLYHRTTWWLLQLILLQHFPYSVAWRRVFRPCGITIFCLLNFKVVAI